MNIGERSQKELFGGVLLRERCQGWGGTRL